MSLEAPLRVPVEISAGARWFRLACAVEPSGLRLAQAVPDEAEGAFAVRFHLPEDARAVRCRARAEEVLVGEADAERAERRLLRFLDLDEESRKRIEDYVTERLGLIA